MNVLLGINVSRPMGFDVRQIKAHTIADDFAFVGSAFMFAGDNIREAVNVKEREGRSEECRVNSKCRV